jgi:hypothetical protein
LQLREVGRVAGCRKYRVEHRLACGTVIGMIDANGGEKRLRIARYEHVGLHFTNDAHDVATQVEVGHKVPIRPIEEMDRLGANDRCRCMLFPMPLGAESIRRDQPGCRCIVVTLVPAREQAILDMMTRLGPMRQRGATEKLRIVRVRKDYQDPPGG